MEIELNDKMFLEMITNFNSESIPDIVLDKNHELKENYGTFQNMRIEENGLMIDLKLNKEGKELIKNETYKYISPMFGTIVDTDKTKHENVLVAITLTNIPALGTQNPKLQSQIALENKLLNQKNTEEKNMNLIALELGLNPDANDAVLLESVRALKSKNIALEAENVKAKTERDTAEKAVTELNGKIELENKARIEKEGETVVTQAIKDGKIMPALKALYLTRYIRDDVSREEVKLEFKTIPAKATGGDTAGATTDIKLTDDQLKAVKKMGIDLKNKDELENFLNELDGGE